MAQNSFSIRTCIKFIALTLSLAFYQIDLNVQAQAMPAKPPYQANAFPVDSSAMQENSLLREPKHPHFLRNAAYVAAGATAWVVAYSLVDEPLQKFSQKHLNTVTNTVSEVVQPLGRQRNLAPVAGAVLLGGLLLKNQKLQKAATLSLGSIVANALATSALKSSFRRHRPSVTSENDLFDAPFSNSHNTSLPSSHTSTAFAVATSVASVYRDHKLVPPIAYGVATLVGLSRVNDNMHWSTDVLAGAAVGYLSARVVNRLYDVASQKLRARQQKLYFTPQVGTTSASMNMTLVF